MWYVCVREIARVFFRTVHSCLSAPCHVREGEGDSRSNYLPPAGPGSMTCQILVKYCQILSNVVKCCQISPQMSSGPPSKPLMSQNPLAARPPCQPRQIPTRPPRTCRRHLRSQLSSAQNRGLYQQAVQAPLKRRLQPRPLCVALAKFLPGSPLRQR